jgi:hypothetical protein
MTESKVVATGSPHAAEFHKMLVSDAPLIDVVRWWSRVAGAEFNAQGASQRRSSSPHECTRAVKRQGSRASIAPSPAHPGEGHRALAPAMEPRTATTIVGARRHRSEAGEAKHKRKNYGRGD